MTSRSNPGKDATNRSGEDTDRANNPSEPADPKVLGAGVDRPVHQGRHFPSGGGSGRSQAAPGTTQDEAAGANSA